MWPGTVTGPSGCGDIRAALGVYVVGAIDPSDRAVVDSHLSWCAECREELAGLAALPGRLGSVPATDVTMLVPDEPGPAGWEVWDTPDATLRSLLERVTARRRHVMWRQVAAAAAVAVIAAGGAVTGPGTRCELLLQGPGSRVIAGGWMVAAGHAGAWYPASAALPVSGVRGFVVATTTGNSLVSVPIR
jgi:anti-sigma factor RsiW